MKTELNDRILWHDGTNQVDPDSVPDLFLLGVPQDKIMVNDLNEDINKFNQLSDTPLSMVKVDNSPFDLSWNIPPEYEQINLSDFVWRKLQAKNLAGGAYLDRARAELGEIEARKIQPLFKTLIYVIDRLKAEDKVWGVGRGSSCASLILHLIGVHEVDPLKYDISLAEFFHD